MSCPAVVAVCVDAGDWAGWDLAEAVCATTAALDVLDVLFGLAAQSYEARAQGEIGALEKRSHEPVARRGRIFLTEN